MSQDAFSRLGLVPDATDEAIREAYLKRVKEHPPDRDPLGFERVHEAFEALRDPRRRARLAVLGEPVPLASILDAFRPARPFLGPEPWRKVLST
jgi:curved DNA-binding protein CbpA